jgi:hypothetical protein
LPRAQSRAQLRAGVLFAQVFFHGVEQPDLFQKPARHLRGLFQGFKEAAPRVRLIRRT